MILRFIDLDAQFLFVPWDKLDELPGNAVPFAIVGAELGPHDAEGTTYDKILSKYELDDPALALLAKVVSSGVHHALHKGRIDENDIEASEGIGLDSLSEGMMMTMDGDTANIENSLAMYDALYAHCRSRVLLRENPSLAEHTFFERNRLIKVALGYSCDSN